MSAWTEFIEEAEKVCDVLARLEKLVSGPLKALFPQIAPEMAVADVVASAVDKAYQEHVAAGNSGTSAVVGLAGVAQAVAASGVVDSATAAKITEISAAVSAVSPEIAQMLSGA